MMPTQSIVETLASVAAPARRPAVRSPKPGWRRSVTWQTAVATSAAKSRAILIWNTGFFSDRGLADDHDDAPQERDDERPPDERQEARQDLLQRLVRGVEAKKAEIDHQRGGRDHRDAEDVKRLHDRDDPVMGLDRVVHLGALKPRRKLAQPMKDRGVHRECS